MDEYFEDEDEIPVHTSFLLGGDYGSLDSGGGGYEETEYDPLSMDSDLPDIEILDPDPLEISPVPVVTKTVSLRKSQRSPPKRVPTAAILATIQTPSQVPSRPVPPPSTVKSLIPPKYKDISYADFVNEMEQSIDDIVNESVAVIEKDPREYHPVYLRIFKYVTIGQQLGYIVGDTKKLWEGFFNFADGQFLQSQKTTVLFRGERSPYATFLLSKKLDDSVTLPKLNETERRKVFRELETKAQRIRDEWNLKAKSGDNIKEDLEIRLKFFNECKMITHPADCLKMNNLWTKFLSDEGFSTKRSSGAKKASGLKVQAPLIVKELIPNEKPGGKEVNEGSRKCLRRFIIKIIVAPPTSSPPTTPSSSSNLPANQPVVDLTTPPASPEPQSVSNPPSPTPPSPCHSPPASPPRSPSPLPEPEKVTSPSKSLKRKQESSPSIPTPSKNVITKEVSEGPSKKQFKLGITARKKILMKKKTIQTTKKPLIRSNALLKKRKLFGKVASNNNESVLERQLKLERMLNQPKFKVLSVTRKKIPKKVDPQKSESKTIDKIIGKLADELTPSKSSPSKSKDSSKPNITIKKKTILRKAVIKKANLKSQRSSTANIFLEKRKKRNALAQLQKKRKEDLQLKVEKMISQKAGKITDRKDKRKRRVTTKLSREETLASKRVTWSHYNKYCRLRTCCPICEQPFVLGTLTRHIKNVHEINEDLWTCPVPSCKKQFNRRVTWLGHTDIYHKGKVNIEALLEIAQNVNTKVDWKTLDVKLPEGRPESIIKIISRVRPRPKPSENTKPKVKKQTFEKVTTVGSDDRQIICDECGESYRVDYLPIHKNAMHNPNRYMSPCPNCEKTFREPTSLWLHYCVNHLTKLDLAFLDPVPLEHREEQRVENGNRRTRGTGGDCSLNCELCGKTFANTNSRIRHMFQIHGEKEKQMFTCPHCPKMYKVKDVLDAHIRTDHEGVGTCSRCGRKHQSSGKLWRHLMDVHYISASEAAEESKVSIVPCPYCGEELLEGRQIINHVKAQHPEKVEEFKFSHSNLPVVVPKSIPMTTMERQKLEKREKRRRFKEEGVGPSWIAKEYNNVQAKRFPCPECGKVYHRRALHFHRKSVHGVDGDLSIDGVRCPIEGCSAILTSNKNMKRHARTIHIGHIEEKIVSRKIVKLVEETEVHKVHLCVLCEAYLYSIQEVIVHVAANHAAVLSDPDFVVNTESSFPAVPPPPLLPPPSEFPCPHCPSIYQSDGEMRGHVEVSHPEMCWPCPECSKLMIGPTDLEKHFEVDHNENAGGEAENTQPEKEKEEKKAEVFITQRHVPLRYRIMDSQTKTRRPRKYGLSEDEAKIFEEERSKLESIVVKCEICEEEVPLGKLAIHLLRTHGVLEEPVECRLCEQPKVFKTINCGRALWMHHMSRYHGESFSMERIVEEASKVQTKEDWRTMEIRNPKGAAETIKSTILFDDNDDDEEELDKVVVRKRGRRRRIPSFLKSKVRTSTLSRKAKAKPERKKKLKSSSEDEEDDSDSDMETEEMQSNEMEAVPQRRTSRLSARKAVNQIKKFVEEEKKGEDVGEYETTDSIAKPVGNVRKRFPRMVMGAGLGKRLLKGAKSITSLRTIKNSVGDGCTFQNIEKEKRLVIKLFRLTEDELKKYVREPENTRASQEDLQEPVIKAEEQGDEQLA